MRRRQSAHVSFIAVLRSSGMPGADVSIRDSNMGQMCGIEGLKDEGERIDRS